MENFMSLTLLKNFIQNELSGWKKAELIWMAFCSLAILGLSLNMQDTPLGIIAALTGTWYTLWAGKGKISCYFFGIINSICYGLISYQYRFFGEVMLNLGYYLPMMFVGIFCWKNHLSDHGVIKKTSLSLKGKAVLLLSTLMAIILYGLLLKCLNGRTPYLDSLTTILSIAAMIMTVKRCSEQWLLWIIVNTASIIMWLNVFLQNGSAISSLLMWIISLANGFIFYFQWAKEVKKQNG